MAGRRALKRIQVWVDCQDGQEEDAKQKLKSALDSLHFTYSILESTSQLSESKGPQK